MRLPSKDLDDYGPEGRRQADDPKPDAAVSLLWMAVACSALGLTAGALDGDFNW